MTIFPSAIPFASNPIVISIAALYRVTVSINEFLDAQIDEMKRNASATVRATGNVLEGAKFGFGIGYITPVVIIAVGQIILGNTFAAAATVTTGVLLINPIAMTCGAVGAIFYGWKALSEVERNGIVNRITDAFQVGAELIKAMINFLLNTLGTMLSAENLDEFKKTVADIAGSFGKSLSDITHSVKDRLSDAASAVASAVGKTADLAMEGVSTAAGSVKKNVTIAAATVVDTADSASQYIRNSTRKD